MNVYIVELYISNRTTKYWMSFLLIFFLVFKEGKCLFWVTLVLLQILDLIGQKNIW